MPGRIVGCSKNGPGIRTKSHKLERREDEKKDGIHSHRLQQELLYYFQLITQVNR